MVEAVIKDLMGRERQIIIEEEIVNGNVTYDFRGRKVELMPQAPGEDLVTIAFKNDGKEPIYPPLVRTKGKWVWAGRGHVIEEEDYIVASLKVVFLMIEYDLV